MSTILLDERAFGNMVVGVAFVLVATWLLRLLLTWIKRLVIILVLLAVVASLSTAILSPTYVDRLTRPRTRDGLPVLQVSESRTPSIAAHIRRAQRDHPEWRQLSYNPTYPPLVTMNRTDACAQWQGAPLSCDEYPFASTLEGGGLEGRDVSIAGVPLHEQRIQGGQLTAFYRQHRLKLADLFLVEVVP